MPENLLLAALPAEERARITPFLHRVRLDVTEMIHPPERPLNEVYFLEGALISVVIPDAEGTVAEAAVAGGEGRGRRWRGAGLPRRCPRSRCSKRVATPS